MHPVTPESTEAMVQDTIRYYDENAEAFWLGTRNHDVSQNRDALLRHVRGEPPHRILDVGCGPGRDLRAFREMGHEPVGLDAAEEVCELARQWSDCTVLRQDLLALDLRAASFHGIFANASLFHVPVREIERVLGDLRRALEPGGVLLASNPRGENEEAWQGNRYCVFYDLEGWSQRVTAVGFEPLEHYYRPPGRPRHEQPWLVTVWRNPDQ